MTPSRAYVPDDISGARVRPRRPAIAAPAVRAAGVITFALLTWAAAKVSVPLPFTPVPGTLQTLAVLLAGAVLGRRAGALSQLSYILMGIAGLPVFALPGAGPLYLLGPTGGYLAGFVLAAWVVGSLSRAGGAAGGGLLHRALAFLAGAAVIHVCGVAWLSVVLGDAGTALRAGLVPFILFDLAKVVLATAIDAGYRRWTPRTID